MSQCESWERGKLPSRGDLLEKPLSLWGWLGGCGGGVGKENSHLFWAAGRKANLPSGTAPSQTAIAHLSKPTELRQSFQMLGNSPTGSFQQFEPSRLGPNVLTSLFLSLAFLNGRFVYGIGGHYSFFCTQIEREKSGSWSYLKELRTMSLILTFTNAHFTSRAKKGTSVFINIRKSLWV